MPNSSREGPIVACGLVTSRSGPMPEMPPALASNGGAPIEDVILMENPDMAVMFMLPGIAGSMFSCDRWETGEDPRGEGP